MERAGVARNVRMSNGRMSAPVLRSHLLHSISLRAHLDCKHQLTSNACDTRAHLLAVQRECNRPYSHVHPHVYNQCISSIYNHCLIQGLLPHICSLCPPLPAYCKYKCALVALI